MKSHSQGADISHSFVADSGKENWVNKRVWGLSVIVSDGLDSA